MQCSSILILAPISLLSDLHSWSSNNGGFDQVHLHHPLQLAHPLPSDFQVSSTFPGSFFEVQHLGELIMVKVTGRFRKILQKWLLNLCGGKLGGSVVASGNNEKGGIFPFVQNASKSETFNHFVYQANSCSREQRRSLTHGSFFQLTTCSVQ